MEIPRLYKETQYGGTDWQEADWCDDLAASLNRVVGLFGLRAEQLRSRDRQSRANAKGDTLLQQSAAPARKSQRG